MSKELLQQALDALETCITVGNEQLFKLPSVVCAKSDLRKALVQPVQTALCQHRFMYFGDQQTRRRCADCNTLEPVQTEQEPVYQYQMANGHWIDQDKGSYDYNVKLGQAVVRVLYASPLKAQPVQPSAKDSEVLVLREALAGAVALAQEAHAHWDADRNSKVGKILLALAGFNAKYDQKADAIHAAIAQPVQPPVELGVSEPCGGCGETDPEMRCLGCAHAFWPITQSVQPKEAK